MIHAQAFDLVHGYQNSRQEKLVFFFEWQSETIDDRAKDFQQFRDSVEPLSLIDELEEDIVDGPSDVRSEIEEFPVYSVKSRLEKVSFTRILRIEKVK